MFLKKSVLAAGIIAALAVPASFAASNANFGQVISSIQASKTGATQIQSITEVKSVTVVKVADLAKGENMTALDNAVTKNEADITSLRSALTANLNLFAGCLLLIRTGRSTFTQYFCCDALAYFALCVSVLEE